MGEGAFVDREGGPLCAKAKAIHGLDAHLFVLLAEGDAKPLLHRPRESPPADGLTSLCLTDSHAQWRRWVGLQVLIETDDSAHIGTTDVEYIRHHPLIVLGHESALDHDLAKRLQHPANAPKVARGNGANVLFNHRTILAASNPTAKQVPVGAKLVVARLERTEAFRRSTAVRASELPTRPQGAPGRDKPVPYEECVAPMDSARAS